MITSFYNSPLHELIEAKPRLASVLYYYGIGLNEVKNEKLLTLCQRKNISIEKIISRFKRFQSNTAEIEKFDKYSLEVILSYLKISHKNFIQYRIPFFLDLIKRLELSSDLSNDLKLIFPIFAEEFISHIRHEEITSFKTVETLIEQHKGYNCYSTHLLLPSLDKDLNHKKEEDLLKGIRELTNNYKTKESDSFEERILLNELAIFDKELFQHTTIENKFLFSKARDIKADLIYHHTSIITNN